MVPRFSFSKRAADAETVEGHPAKVPAGLAAKVLVLRALDDAEQGLVGLPHPGSRQSPMFDDAALGPATRPFQGFLLVATGVLQCRQLVEGEHDVGADLVLHPHGDLRARNGAGPRSGAT